MLNFCTRCGRNFARPGMYRKHRTGSYTPNARRCKTDAELQADNFVAHERQERIIREGKPLQVVMQTWIQHMTEEQRAYFHTLHA